MAASEPAVTPKRGWILYDGQCRFCTGWITLARSTLERHGFLTDTLQSPWIVAKLDMPIGELLNDIRLLTPDGRLINGADAYRYVLRRIWWTWPLWIMFSLPGLKQIFAWVYRRVATNRYCVGGTCDLPYRRS